MKETRIHGIRIHGGSSQGNESNIQNEFAKKMTKSTGERTTRIRGKMMKETGVDGIRSHMEETVIGTGVETTNPRRK